MLGVGDDGGGGGSGSESRVYVLFDALICMTKNSKGCEFAF